jgi:hypothetical protein
MGLTVNGFLQIKALMLFGFLFLFFGKPLSASLVPQERSHHLLVAVCRIEVMKPKAAPGTAGGREAAAAGLNQRRDSPKVVSQWPGLRFGFGGCEDAQPALFASPTSSCSTDRSIVEEQQLSVVTATRNDLPNNFGHGRNRASGRTVTRSVFTRSSERTDLLDDRPRISGSVVSRSQPRRTITSRR